MLLLWLGTAFAGPATWTGSAFADATANLDDRARQRAAVARLVDHAVPSFLSHLAPVRYEAADALGTLHVVEVAVLPDYLAIGTDDDFLRFGLDLPGALAVARAWGMALPTPKLVDAIYAAASVRLAPIPLAPGPDMRSIGYLLRHHDLIGAQGANAPAAALRAGHKKDVVLTRKLVEQPDRVAIYGWHVDESAPIQPLSLWHGAGYADYSHGVRLVDPIVRVDGAVFSLFDLLADPSLAPLVSDEGPIPEARALIEGCETP